MLYARKKEDELFFADCLWEGDRLFRKEAAEIYARNGREDPYIECLMESLAKDTEDYVKAIE